MKLLPWLLLILILGLVYAFWPNPTPDYSLHEARIAQREQAISELQQDYEKERQRRKTDSANHVAVTQFFVDVDRIRINEINRLKANPTIVKVRSEVPAIDSLIHSYDTLLASKDAQLHMQGKYISTLQVDVTQLTHNFEERIALQDSTINDQREIITDLTNRLNKKKTVWQKLGQIGKDILKVGAGVVIGRISK